MVRELKSTGCRKITLAHTDSDAQVGEHKGGPAGNAGSKGWVSCSPGPDLALALALAQAGRPLEVRPGAAPGGRVLGAGISKGL